MGRRRQAAWSVVLAVSQPLRVRSVARIVATGGAEWRVPLPGSQRCKITCEYFCELQSRLCAGRPAGISKMLGFLGAVIGTPDALKHGL